MLGCLLAWVMVAGDDIGIIVSVGIAGGEELPDLGCGGSG